MSSRHPGKMFMNIVGQHIKCAYHYISSQQGHYTYRDHFRLASRDSMTACDAGAGHVACKLMPAYRGRAILAICSTLSSVQTRRMSSGCCAIFLRSVNRLVTPCFPSFLVSCAVLAAAAPTEAALSDHTP